MPGPTLRTDIVEVYVFRRPPGVPGTPGSPAFLQMRRTVQPMAGSWHPVMGHINEGETAAAAALRELAEEAHFAPGRGLLAFWQLESVDTFFLAAQDAILMCPGFAAEVAADAEPVLDPSHDAARWVPAADAGRLFLWPGQRAAVEQIVRDILPPDAPMRGPLRLL